MKRLLLVITVVALIAALMAPTAQAEPGYWYWCWDNSSGSWGYCWWNGIEQSSGQDVSSGTATQTVNVQ